jgi:hypothetical protein
MTLILDKSRYLEEQISALMIETVKVEVEAGLSKQVI